MKKKLLFTLLILSSTIAFPQIGKFYKKKKYAKESKSAIHKKYEKQIVFSHDVINMGSEDESSFINEFTHGDVLNFRVYMESPLEEILKRYKKGFINQDYVGYKWHFILDGEQVSVSDQVGWSMKAIKSWSTWRGSMNDSENPNNTGNKAYKQFINDAAIAGKMTKGKHDLEIKLYPVNPSYRGSKELEVIASCKLIMHVKAGFKVECLPPAKMNNASLESQMLQIIQEKAKAEGWSETFKKARIVSEDWEVETDPYLKSQIDRRIISAILTAQWPDGHCTYQGFSFSQEYKSMGEYSKRLDYYSTGRQVKIPCDCLK